MRQRHIINGTYNMPCIHCLNAIYLATHGRIYGASGFKPQKYIEIHPKSMGTAKPMKPPRNFFLAIPLLPLQKHNDNCHRKYSLSYNYGCLLERVHGFITSFTAYIVSRVVRML